jgi:hypothetical protein
MQALTPTRGYYIRSSTDSTRFYLVAENPRGFLECECKAAQFCRTKACKHVVQVRRGCGLAAKLKARTAPGKGLEDAGCTLHTDCGYTSAEHWGVGPYGEGYTAPRTVTVSAEMRDFAAALEL